MAESDGIPPSKHKAKTEWDSGTAVREGDVIMGMIANINVNGIKGTPATNVTIEVSGSPLRFYASPTNNGTPGGTFLDIQAGQTVTKTAGELITLIGLGNTSEFFNVQNIGAMTGHYKITFDNLGEE